jgi:uncharacterized protein
MQIESLFDFLEFDPKTLQEWITSGDPNLSDSNGVTLLIVTANQLDEDNVRRLLQRGADVHAHDRQGATALLYVAGNRSVADGTAGNLFGDTTAKGLRVAEMLLAAGSDVDAKQLDGSTTLMVAAVNMSVSLVATLLKHDADVNSQDNLGRTALWHAAGVAPFDFLTIYADNSSVLLTLLEGGADINIPDREDVTPLLNAVESGIGSHVTLLVERGASCKVSDEWKTLALLMESLGGVSPDFRQRLQRATAEDINASPVCERTALSWAAERGDLAMVNLLLEQGALVEEADELGITPLYYAILNKHNAVVEKLLTVGADINRCVSYGDSGPSGNALYWACESENTAIIPLLVERGVNILREDGGISPSVAGYLKQVSLLHQMLEAGAEVTLSDAAGSGDVDLVQSLLDTGADINEIEENYGTTPLTYVSQTGDAAMVQFLLSRGAEVNQKNRYGKTALSFAQERGHNEIISLLKAAGA